MSTEEKINCNLCALLGGPHANHTGDALDGSVAAPWVEADVRRRLADLHREVVTESEGWLLVIPEEMEFTEEAGQEFEREVLAELTKPVPDDRDGNGGVPDPVLQMLGDALAAAREGQTVRLTVEDRDGDRRGTWAVVQRSEERERERKWDLTRKIRRELDWREGE